MSTGTGRRRMMMKKDGRIKFIDSTGVNFFMPKYESSLPEVKQGDGAPATLYEHEEAVEERDTKSEFLTIAFEVQMTAEEEDPSSGSPYLALQTGNLADLPLGANGSAWVPFETPDPDAINFQIEYWIDMGAYWRIWDYGPTKLMTTLSGDGKLKFDGKAVGYAADNGKKYPKQRKIAKTTTSSSDTLTN